MKIAVLTGSFDPPTRGHLDLILRCRKLFDRVVVLIAYNAQKTGWFDFATRRDLLLAALGTEPKAECPDNLAPVEVRSCGGLVGDTAKEILNQMQKDYPLENSSVVFVRGVRNSLDLAAELAMAQTNLELAGVETILLSTSPEFAHISSSLVKEIATYGRLLDKLVTEDTARALRGHSQWASRVE